MLSHHEVSDDEDARIASLAAGLTGLPAGRLAYILFVADGAGRNITIRIFANATGQDQLEAMLGLALSEMNPGLIRHPGSS